MASTSVSVSLRRRCSEAQEMYLFPRAITVPDHLHGIYNAQEEGFKSSEAWTPFEPLFRQACNFFGDQTNRDRFQLRPSKDSDNFERFPGRSTFVGGCGRFCPTSG